MPWARVIYSVRTIYAIDSLHSAEYLLDDCELLVRTYTEATESLFRRNTWAISGSESDDWDMTPWRLVEIFKLLQDLAASVFYPKIKVAISSTNMANFCQSIRRHI